jgi:hypothetical protein
VQYTKAAGGGVDFPQLEGVRINGHWAIIYSKYDIGCALERHTGIECKGYTYESALKIAGNIVIYSTLPCLGCHLRSRAPPDSRPGGGRRPRRSSRL